ncbi:MAG: aminopeptidase [marine bacterium B5-7]|nr:MAG: aminopeptidase [marine bacterium B5-7]
MTRPRARDLGLDLPGYTGPMNAITDIPDVLVGVNTRIEGDGPLRTGHGPVRTGVTTILPRGRESEPRPVWAGLYALNGNGELTGSHWIRDGGYFVGPICITNTHGVGAVHHGATQWMLRQYAHTFENEHLWAMPVVAETYDGVLNDINGMHITPNDALKALDAASDGPVPEGNTGGGTGMICYELKGGTGSASRLIDLDGSSYTMAALVQANHGTRPWFTALGVPVGRYMTDDRLFTKGEQGSIIVVLGTDAPLLPHQLERLARRAAIGIGRGGTPGGNNSGDIFLAFSVANSRPLMQFDSPKLTLECLNDEVLDNVYLAAVEAVEEAVLNALVAAQDMTTLRPYGRVCRAIDHDQLTDIMRKHGRCR